MPKDELILEQIAALRTTIETNAISSQQAIAALEEKLALTKEFATLREDVNAKFRLLQWSASAVTVAVALIGGVGLKSATDYITAVKSEFAGRLDRVSSYYYEFSRGVTALNSGNLRESVASLRRCFDENHYDEGLLVPFLHALDRGEDWEQAADVITILKQQPKLYDKLAPAWVWGNLASMHIQIAVEKPEWLRDGRESLTRFDRLLDPSDLDMLRASYLQHWMIALIERNQTLAGQYIDKIAAMPSTIKVDSWNKVRTWRFIKELFRAHPEDEGATSSKYVNTLTSRFRPDEQ